MGIVRFESGDREFEATSLVTDWPTMAEGAAVKAVFADRSDALRFLAANDLLGTCEVVKRWIEEDTLKNLDELSGDAKAILRMVRSAVAKARGQEAP